MSMWPFFTFYGGKWRSANRYPAPVHRTIVEPFAGSAGYAVRNAGRDVVLVERDPAVAAVWRFLIGAKASDVAALPLLTAGQSVDDFDLPPGAGFLIGFWLNKGAASPCKTPGAWMRSGVRPKSYWGAEIRDRIAGQVAGISHWQIVEGDYADAPDVPATWFIDAPYRGAAGKLYRQSSAAINFDHLAAFCRSRRGQVIACENSGADWLPFSDHIVSKSTPGSRGKSKSREAIWLN